MCLEDHLAEIVDTDMDSSKSKETSSYLSDEGLNTFNELDRFEKGLRTGKPRKEQMWNEQHSRMVYVKSLGHINPEQFKKQFAPMNSLEDSTTWWETEEKDTFLHKNVDYKMDDLVESVKKHGIVRPVIVGNPVVFPSQVHEGTQILKPDAKPYHPEVLDGIHRVIAASRAGVNIPVNILDKRHQQVMEDATYNLSTDPRTNPAFAKPASRKRKR